MKLAQPLKKNRLTPNWPGQFGAPPPTIFFKWSGFTIIEFLIATAIIGILLAVAIIPFANFRDKQLLDSTSQEVVSLINEARSRTLSSEGGSNYGVLFQTDRATLFKGNSWPGQGDPNNKAIIFHNRLEIGDIGLAGGVWHAVFKRLTGSTDQNGWVRLRLKSDPSSYRQILIEPSGLVAVQ